ncbi:ComF family protein [Streptomyces sp. NPDC049687]|uniref:ComF family protein n=1 Tax=Streptomyces sp. NPDC049687 TaxID=3365596 RepID=UPI0037B2AFCD
MDDVEGVRRWWQELAGLVLPAECGGCGRARTVLCPQCRAALGGNPPRQVRPVPEPAGLPVVHAAARYADEVRAVLLAHKERGGLALARPLGVALAGAVWVGLGEAGVGVGEGPPSPGDVLLPPGNAFPPPNALPPPRNLLLVPVPSAPAATRARGHDPVRRLALSAAGELRRAGLPVRVAGVLRQRRTVADQAGLNSRQRLDNLSGALAVVPGGGRVLCGGAVVLVDDLVTTGASLAEAARAVRAATAAERAGWAERRGGMAAPAWSVGRLGMVGAGGEVGWAGCEEGGLASGEGVSAVCPGVSRGGGGVQPSPTGEGGVGGVAVGAAGVGRGGEVLCAAVVAAPPDSFVINRN